MELKEELIESAGLNEDQVKVVNDYYSNGIATLKNEWDGLANDNAEKIILGAIKSTTEKFGVDIERKEGEKNHEFLTRLNETVVSSEQRNIEKLKTDYNKKLKEFEGGDALKSELEKVKTRLDDALKKEAIFDEWEKEDYKGKYENTNKEYNTLKNRLAFSNVKPSFPDSVNAYEAKAKWKEFEDGVNEKYTIEIDENNDAIAIDKENKHRQVKLAELVKSDSQIQSLTQDYKPNGLGSSTGKSIDGLPFTLREGDNIPAAISQHLLSKGLDVTSTEYGKEYAKIWAQVREKTPV